MKLEIGYNFDIEIRCEKYSQFTDNQISIMYISDFHFNSFAEKTVIKLLDIIEKHNPTILIFGGDYTDTKRGFLYFETLLQRLKYRQNLFLIAGNHDYFFGIDKIKKVAEKNNFFYLENQYKKLIINDIEIVIDGTIETQRECPKQFRILCLHEPRSIDFENYDLVFAGHLHGCQFVFWENEQGLFPGKWFYKWNFLKKTIGNCQYFISKGIGDTLAIRYNCKRDIILIKY
jgi:uncharacterized protein